MTEILSILATSFNVLIAELTLLLCIKEEQHVLTQFLWAEGVPGAEIYCIPSAQFGNSALPQ
jgi:hypothetical protein